MALAQNGDEEGLAEEWERLQATEDDEGPRVNFLYYMLRGFLRGDRERQAAWHKAEAEVGHHAASTSPRRWTSARRSSSWRRSSRSASIRGCR